MSDLLNKDHLPLPRELQRSQNNDEMLNLPNGQDNLINLSLKFQQLFKNSLHKEMNKFQMYQNDNITFEELMHSYELEKQLRFQLICRPKNNIQILTDNNKFKSPLKEANSYKITTQKENQKNKMITPISVLYKENTLSNSYTYKQKNIPKFSQQEKNIQQLFSTPQKVANSDKIVNLKQNKINETQNQSENLRDKIIKQNTQEKYISQSIYSEQEIVAKNNVNLFVFHNKNIEATITIKDDTIFYEIQNILNKFIDDNKLF
ncbi:hypothetical protein ABPG72_008420 [Tetrahymena utriculariae]